MSQESAPSASLKYMNEMYANDQILKIQVKGGYIFSNRKMVKEMKPKRHFQK